MSEKITLINMITHTAAILSMAAATIALYVAGTDTGLLWGMSEAKAGNLGIGLNVISHIATARIYIVWRLKKIPKKAGLS